MKHIHTNDKEDKPSLKEYLRQRRLKYAHMGVWILDVKYIFQQGKKFTHKPQF